MTRFDRVLYRFGHARPSITADRMKGGSNQMRSVEETAERLGVSSCTVYRQWRKWGLHGYRIGRRLMFRERDIDTWLESRRI